MMQPIFWIVILITIIVTWTLIRLFIFSERSKPIMKDIFKLIVESIVIVILIVIMTNLYIIPV